MLRSFWGIRLVQSHHDGKAHAQETGHKQVQVKLTPVEDVLTMGMCKIWKPGGVFQACARWGRDLKEQVVQVDDLRKVKKTFKASIADLLRLMGKLQGGQQDRNFEQPQAPISRFGFLTCSTWYPNDLTATKHQLIQMPFKRAN